MLYPKYTLWLQWLKYVSQPTETRRCKDNAPVCASAMTSWSLTDLSALGIHWALSSGKRMRERRWIRYVITLDPPLLSRSPPLHSFCSSTPTESTSCCRASSGRRTNERSDSLSLFPLSKSCVCDGSHYSVFVSEPPYVPLKSSSGVRPSWCDSCCTPLWRSGIFTVFLGASVCWKWFLGFQSPEMARRFRMDAGISAVVLLLLSVLSQQVSTNLNLISVSFVFKHS